MANKIYLGEDIIKLEHYQNEQTNRSGYLKGLAIDCYNNPDNDRNSHYFAREMMYLGRFKSAIKEFLNHISMNRWPTEAAQSMLYVGDCYAHMGNTDEMIKWYGKSIEKENRREPYMRLAEHYFKKGMYSQCVAYCEAALSVTQLPFYSNHQPYYENVPHELLYISYWWLGNKVKSAEHYFKALAWKPNHPRYIEDGKFYNQADIKFTGERYIPGINRPDMEMEHYARYNFASKFTKDMIVLDAACGSGYGKDILKAKTYYGVDLAEDVIKENIVKYGEGFSVENLENGVTLNIKPDVVITFETIEHLENPNKLLEWIRDNAKQIVFSIPVNMPSEFHKVVYSIDEIKSLMNKYFFDIKFYEQDGETITAESNNPRYIVGVAYCKEQPKVTFVVPSLGREEGLNRCVTSINDLNYPQGKIELIVKYDSYENRTGVPKLVKQGVEESTGDWIVFASNDTEFTPDSINEALAVGEKGYVAFNTGEVYEDGGNANEHFMIRKDIIEKIGEVFDTDFYHCGVDNLLMAKMKKMGIFVRADKAIVNHYHFTKGAEMDKVYDLGWSHVDDDRELLKKKLAELI